MIKFLNLFIFFFSHLSTSIGQDVVPGCIAIAKFNPEEPKDQIAVACRGGKVCIYNLSELAARTTTYYKPVTVIDVKDEVISIAAAPWKTGAQKYQLLLIASSSTIQLYDIYENHSLFHRILPDEIRTISIGCVAEKTEPWILTGKVLNFYKRENLQKFLIFLKSLKIF